MMKHLCDGSLFSSIFSGSVVALPSEFTENSSHQLNEAFLSPGIHQFIFDTKAQGVDVLSKILPLYASLHPPIGFITFEEPESDLDENFFEQYLECQLIILELPRLGLTCEHKKKLLDLHIQNGISLILISYTHLS